MEKFASQRYTSKSVVHGLRVISGPVGAPATRSAGERRHPLQAVASEWLLNLKVEGRSPRTLHWYRQQVRMYLDRGGATTLAGLVFGYDDKVCRRAPGAWPPHSTRVSAGSNADVPSELA